MSEALQRAGLSGAAAFRSGLVDLYGDWIDADRWLALVSSAVEVEPKSGPPAKNKTVFGTACVQKHSV